MKVNITLPFDHIDLPEEFLTPEAVVEVARLVEKLGFDGSVVTDHPCPTGRWLDAGGHYAQDPFVMLSFVASATTALRLQTGILVIPYRNPFITARAVSTLDVYSCGRVTLGLAAGYLKGEFRALGVDFERRNDITDEYLRALKTALSSEEFCFKGTSYEARGNRVRPGPVQKPHPPILTGGNSRRAIRRAVDLADGWHPFFASQQLSSTARTASMADESDLAGGIAYMREYCEQVGRENPPMIVLSDIIAPGENPSPAELVDCIGQYAALGVSGVGVHMEGRTRAEWCDRLSHFATDVLHKLTTD